MSRYVIIEIAPLDYTDENGITRTSTKNIEYLLIDVSTNPVTVLGRSFQFGELLAMKKKLEAKLQPSRSFGM